MLGTASKSALLPVSSSTRISCTLPWKREEFPGPFLYQGKKTTETVFYHILRHLISMPAAGVPLRLE